MIRSELIEEYHKVYFSDIILARKLIKTLDYKSDHQLLQMIAQTYLDEARFVNTGGNREQYDRRKLRYAERYIMEAFRIRPNCSNVLWTLAKIRTDYGQNEAAIFCYQDIIRLGVKRISLDSCKNELCIVLAQINDSKFELYRLFHKRNPQLSKRYLTLYYKGLKRGISTLYKPVTKYLLPESIGR